MSTVTPETAVAIDAVRQFSRFYTRRIGVLDEGVLGSPFSLSEVRVLYELAQRPGLIASDLIRDLDLDAGYLSRMLGRLKRLKLIDRTRSEQDGRASHLRLTTLGQEQFAELNERSSAQAGKLIGHLPVVEQQRLVGLMHSVRQLLTEPEEKAPAVKLRDPLPGDLGWVVQRHGALYAQEYGWNQEFEALVARIVADYVEKSNPERERCWIAELDGQPVGCLFLVRKTVKVAKLRLLLVEPIARGHKVGRRLVDACIGFARAAGYQKVELWTNSVLTAARHIYEKAGFRLMQSEPHRSFGQDLVAETWVLDLD